MSSASDHKLFCEVCSAFNCSFDEFVGEKVVSPSYSSAILAPPPVYSFFNVLEKFFLWSHLVLGFSLLRSTFISWFVVVVQWLSRVQLLATPWTAARQASLSFTVSWSLLKLMSIESVMPSNHLILCHPRLLLPSVFPSITVFSNESALHIRWYWSFSFSISPSNEYLGLISFRIDWFDLLPVQDYSQESSPAPPFKSISSSVLSFLYGPTLTSIHDHWKNHSFDYTDLCRQSDNVSAFRYAV